MSGSLTNPPRVVARMLVEKGDGRVVPVVFLAFEGENEGDASPHEVLAGGRLAPCTGLSRLNDWRKLAALAAEGG